MGFSKPNNKNLTFFYFFYFFQGGQLYYFNDENPNRVQLFSGFLKKVVGFFKKL